MKFEVYDETVFIESVAWGHAAEHRATFKRRGGEVQHHHAAAWSWAVTDKVKDHRAGSGLWGPA